MRVSYRLTESRVRLVAMLMVAIASACFLADPSLVHAQAPPQSNAEQEEKKPPADAAKPTQKEQGNESSKGKQAKSKAPKQAKSKAPKGDSKKGDSKTGDSKKGDSKRGDLKEVASSEKDGKGKPKEAEEKKAQDDRIDALEKKLAALEDAIEQQAKEAQPQASKSDSPKEPKTKPPGKAKGDEPAKSSQPSKQPTADGEKKAATEEKPATEAATKPNNASQEKPTGIKIDSQWMQQLAWRPIGPANMSGRIADISVDDKDPSLWWIGTAGAGLLKTTNHGVKLEHQFDHETTSSVGAVAHSPSDNNIVWVGAGEANPRNSVSYGNGVYKSTDGGKTWEHKGLDKTFQIARILIHPKDPNVVYVGAAGRLYGASRERGVYKTTDGGETWKQVLYVDDNTGVTEMIMNPQDPEMIIVAMWDRMRDGFDSWPGSVKKPDGVDGYDPIRKWGPGAGLFKTVNGGAEWKRLSDGLPTGKFGRVGLDWQRKGSGAIYAIIDCEDIGKGPKPSDAYLGLVGTDRSEGKKSIAVITQVMPDSPAAKAKIQPGDALVEIDGKKVKTFDDLLEILRNKQLGQKIKLLLSREGETLEVDIKLPGRPGSNARMPTVYLGVTGETKDSQVVLKTVAEKTPGAAAGLKPGDVVAAADGKPVESYDALVKLVQAKSDGEKLVLTVKRDEEQLELDE